MSLNSGLPFAPTGCAYTARFSSFHFFQLRSTVLRDTLNLSILRISQWLPSDLDRREHAFSIALRDPLAPLVLVEDIKNVVSFLEKTYFVAV